MLKPEEKQRRVQRTKQHQNDAFTRTIFTDESSLQLFRNTVRRWSKHPKMNGAFFS
jgi:hypothetical protein